jgi:hypothetical protein
MRRKAIDPAGLIEYWTDRIERLLRACVRDRELIPADHSVDIGFHQLGGNAITILADIYARNGTELPDRTRSAFRRYLTEHPRGKQVRYDLRRHFGCSAEDIRSRFEFYFERFDVRPEA